MSAIAAVLVLGTIVWAATLLAGRQPSPARWPLAIAIMLGLTGYLLAGQPARPGAPVVRVQQTGGFGEALADPRAGMSDRFGPAAGWLGMSDGLLRGGNTLGATRLLEQGLRHHPRDLDLWIGYGNALVAHSGGLMTPAASMAFDRAAALDPAHPAPQFFSGLALAQGGDLVAARRLWQQLLDRSPPDAPWRADLSARLAQLPPGPAEPALPNAIVAP